MDRRKETEWDKEILGRKKENDVKVEAYSNPKMPSFN